MNKSVTIQIPYDENLPEGFLTFTPQKVLLAINIGCKCVIDAEQSMLELTEEMIYNKVKDETNGELKRLEMDLLVERDIARKMDERTTNKYEEQIDRYKKQIDNLACQLRSYESDNKDIINEAIKKEKEKCELLLKEKDKQNLLNRESFDKALTQLTKNKTAKEIGEDGEDIFNSLSNTFKDFKGYKIENKSKQGHKGDFHLFFEEFNVLVDAKNYVASVQKKEIDKIENDLRTNDNMKFAWLVSLNTDIAEYNRFSIMNKWIMTDKGSKCIILVNNLLNNNKDPKNTLRLLWLICNEFNKLTRETKSDNAEIQMYKDRDLLLENKIQKMQDRTAEIKRSINGTLYILKQMDNELLESLSVISNKIINKENEKYDKISNWWHENIEYTKDNVKLTSTEIWTRFKKINKEYIAENNISIDLFKETVIDIFGNIENYKKGAVIEFQGCAFKKDMIQIETETAIETEKAIQTKNKEVKLRSTIKKIVKAKSLYFFDESTDNKILEEYNDQTNNIITISNKNNVKIWEIVSLLMRYKIIEKRDNARGYDIYKTMEEYTNKITSKI
jgi:hypothetical protein